nr:hypothetical protein [Tanacetum cinerariifolium]
CKLFPLLGKLSTVSVFLSFGLTFAGTFKYWGVLRMIMISLRLISLVSKDDTTMIASWRVQHRLSSNGGFHCSIPSQDRNNRRGNHIIATVDGIQRTISESSLRRNLKLRDEDGIVSIPDTELFENLTLMGNIATALVCLATNRTYNFSKMIYDGMVKNGEGSGTPTEPHHIHSPEADTSHPTTLSIPLPSLPTAPIPPGRSINEGETAAERISDGSEKLARVLTSMDAATVLAGGIDVPTSSGSIPTAGPPAADISTGSEVVPAASLIVTSYSRRKGKEVMRRPMTKKQKMDYYMTMIRNNLGWKVKDFKGMTFEEIEAKFAAVWKHVEDFIPMGSKEEAERLKRKGFNLEQEHVKKQKTSEEAPDIEKSTEEILEEKMKEMMQLVPVEEVYVQPLQVKHPIIDGKVYTEGQRSYWKIIRLGGSSACYQFFIDLLKQLDREDLNQLWALVKEYLSIRPAISEKRWNYG